MSEIPDGWSLEPLTGHVRARSGNSKIIKGKNSAEPRPGLNQGFSASGPDVWVKEAEYKGPGVVVSAVGARCGKTFLADGVWTAIANTHVLIPEATLDPRFLWYLTNNERYWVRSGTAQPFVKVKDTLARPHLIPPLDEQRRIVAILEDHLSRLDSAVASLNQILDRLETYRLALHGSAMVGRVGDDVFAAENWPLLTLDDLRADDPAAITDGPFGSNLKSSHYTDNGARVIRLQNVGLGDFINVEAFISLEHFETLRKHEAIAGDLIVASLGDVLPRVCILPELGQPAIVKADCIRIRLGEKARPRWVLMSMLTPQARRWAKGALHGVGRMRLGLKAIRQFSLPVPDLAVQDAILDAVDAHLTMTSAVESSARRTLLLTDAMRRTLLAAAFAGELTKEPSLV